jgi:hypothetical protein
MIKLLLILSLLTFQTDESPKTSPTPALKRTVVKNEVRRFGYGSTLTVLGPPTGSITVEGWNRSEVDISAEVELRADREEDLNKLAQVTGFILDEDVSHIKVMTTGPHDKKYLSRIAKDFPKKLRSNPWRIDYKIRVPVSTDLLIYHGDGKLKLSGVEGSLQLHAANSQTDLTLTGGSVNTVVASGDVQVRLDARSWRGRGAEIRLARGNMIVECPIGLNAEIEADILQSGKITNHLSGYTKRERSTPTDHSIKGRAGAGGATLKFVVGTGNITFKLRS